LPALPGKRWYRLGDVFQLSEAEYDPGQSQLYVHYTFIRDSVIQTGTARYSLYTIAEFKRMFSACGFAVRDLYSSTDKEPYRLGSQRLLIVAEKPGSRCSDALKFGAPGPGPDKARTADFRDKLL
jgi:hypothetical protein